MRSLLTFLLLILAFPHLQAQLNQGNTQWMQYLEELAESEESENYSIEHLFDELSYLSENPFDLNTVKKTDLEKLPFLSSIQIENILYYIYRYAPLSSIYELKNVDDLDMQTIQYLLPFVFVGEIKETDKIQPQKIVRYGKHDLFLRSDYCLQEKAGYRSATQEKKEESPNKFYLGEPYYLSLKYGFQYKDRIQFGISGEKDPGEAFWNKNHHGFDFYSINLVIKNMGILQGLYLGDYRLSFGQGLVLNSDFSMGKTSDVSNISKKNGGIKRHFSTAESGFFRGAAGTLKLNRTKLSLFYSHVQSDANTDSSTIFTFKTDGYNRTVKDLEKRRQSTIDTYGTHIQWEKEGLSLGMTAVYYSFGGKELNPELKPYNLFTLRAENNYNAGINYGLLRKKYSFQGETAMGANGSMATINNFHFNPASFIDLIFSYRNYSRNYQAFYSRALSESSSTQNESGFYTGMKLKFLKKWESSFYLDQFQFPWLKYGVNAPSSGTDVLFQLAFNANRNLQISARYKYKMKDKNMTPDKAVGTLVLPYEQQRWRGLVNYQTEKGISLKTQFDYNTYQIAQQTQPGWSISQTLGYNSTRFPVQLDGALAYFHASDWNARISVYEKNILYAFSFPFYYGEGMRYYAVVRWKISPNFSFYLKAATTRYFDRNTISSDLEEIQGREKSDISCLLRVLLK